MSNFRKTSGITMLIKPVSSACNLACGYCFYKDAVGHRGEKNHGVMSPGINEKLIEKVFDSAPSFVSFVFQGGEPLLARYSYFVHFTELVNQSNQKRIPVFYSIQTNGTLITEEFSRFFHANDWLVGVSLDGDEDLNDHARVFEDGKGSFQAVNNGISRLKKEGVRFNILSVVTSANYEKASETYLFFKNQGFEYLQFIPCLDFIDGDNRLALSPAQWLQFQCALFDRWYEDIMHGKYVSIRSFDNYVNLLNGHPADSCASKGVCGGYLVCESNGDIFPCDFYCLDEYKLGNILHDSLDGMTQTEKYRGFVSDSLLIHEKCASCQYYRLCHGGCKKERGKDLTRHLFCSSYKTFFDYSLSRLRLVAEEARKGTLKNS